MIVEGVHYHRYLARYTLNEGKRRRKVLWAPGRQYAAEAFDRFVAYCDVPIKPGSNVYMREYP